MKFELKDICFFDCETTGVPAKGLKWDADFNQFPHVVQLAWAFGDKERSFIIKPDNYEIPPETTAIHGITTERAIAEGVPFAEVIDEFLTDAARPGKGNRQPDGKLGRIGTGRIRRR